MYVQNKNGFPTQVFQRHAAAVHGISRRRVPYTFAYTSRNDRVKLWRRAWRRQDDVQQKFRRPARSRPQRVQVEFNPRRIDKLPTLGARRPDHIRA